MKTLHLHISSSFLPVLSAGMVLLLLIVAGSTATAQNHLQEEIEAVNSRFEAGVAKGDGEAVASLYMKDAQLLPPNQPLLEGQQAIAAAMQGMIDMGVRGIDLTTQELEGDGTTAHEIGSYTLFGENGQSIDEGKYTVIWKKDGGTWKLHRDIWNSSQPAPAPPEQPGMIVLNQNMCAAENMDELHGLSDDFFGPVLDELVDEGKLLGWGELSHGWGDEWNHNVYFSVKDHRSFVDFWETFTSRLNERDSGWYEKLAPLCSAHKDNMYTVRRMR